MRSPPTSSAPTASSGAPDYPHPDAFYPNFVEMLNENLAGMSTEDQDRIRGRNALDFYKLPDER